MSILLHACCAPCATYCTREMSKSDEVVLFWFNPNIHPFREYGKRLESMVRYGNITGTKVMIRDEYLLMDFLKGALGVEERCVFCYEWRLEETARAAAENGFDGFSTTLSLSPYQDHDIIRKVGEDAADRHGVDFLYKDMRSGFRESHELARKMDLYMQGYCGCIFSEEERYCKKAQSSSR